LDPNGNMDCWLRVPMCPRCAWVALRGQILYVAVMLIVFASSVAAIGFFTWDHESRSAMKFVALVVCIPALVAIFGWSWIFPPLFSFASDKTMFDFRSKAAADAFKQLNQPPVAETAAPTPQPPPAPSRARLK